MEVPSVFVSSTCYDLEQVRADLRDFILGLGLRPILSEYSSFPVNPDLAAVRNCLTVVRQHAEIFVLICGDRYGTVDSSGRSFTNLEYVEARAKGIPIYIFVKRKVLQALPLWRNNPDINVTNFVDSAKLLEFVQMLHDSGDHWVYPFDRADEIIGTLREQLARLFGDGLQLRQRITGNPLPAELLALDGEPLRLVLERPKGWEYRLFVATVKQQFLDVANLKYYLTQGLGAGNPVRVQPRDLVDWFHSKNNELRGLVRTVKALVEDSFQDAIGAPGQPGDASKIAHVANRFGDCYRHILEWSLEFQDLALPEEFDHLRHTAAQWPLPTLTNLEELIDSIESGLHEALENVEEGKKRVLTYEITFELSDHVADEIVKEMERLKCAGHLSD